MTQSSSSAPETVDPLIGQVAADRYRILEPIARGGMGRIYKAEQVGLGRLVALKVLDDRSNDPEGFRKRFTLEAATSAKLSHPNIVIVHDYGSFELDGVRRYFMAMELIEGPTLGALLKQHGGRLPVGRAAFIAREIARALRDAHRHGVVHRDLKPSNVMLVERADGDHVKVLDFGIAKVMQGAQEQEGEEQLTREGVLVGTPRYMSPEQLTGGTVDARSDLYSLGVLLYQMLAGRTPYAAKDHVQAIVAHLQDPLPELPDEVVHEVPPALRDVIRTCMQKSPAERYADATAFLRALDAAAAGLPGWAGPPASGELPIARGSGSFSASEDPSYPSGSGPRALGSLITAPSSPSVATPAPAVADAPTRIGRRGYAGPREAETSAEQSAPSHSRAGLVATVGMSVLLVGALAAWGLSRVTTAVEPEPPAPPGTAPPTPVAPPPTPPPAPTPAPTRFRLTIASTPVGASVIEDGVTIGATPLTVELDAATLRTAPRAYRLELPGHAPYLFTQGPSERDVEVMASLVALPETSDRPTRPVRTIRPTRPRDEGAAIGPGTPEDRMLKTSR
ncbi:MAG: hypothetical protein OHK0013_25600 [Sandaracinaceae bacterium]